VVTAYWLPQAHGVRRKRQNNAIESDDELNPHSRRRSARAAACTYSVQCTLYVINSFRPLHGHSSYLFANASERRLVAACGVASWAKLCETRQHDAPIINKKAQMSLWEDVPQSLEFLLEY